MITVDILSRKVGVPSPEIEQWVGLAWLSPVGEPGRWLFQDMDVARVRLIVELRALRIDAEAMPVVLSLMDQLYEARGRLRLLQRAVEEGAPGAAGDVRGRLLALLQA